MCVVAAIVLGLLLSEVKLPACGLLFAGGTDARCYAYDTDGNRTSQTINGVTATFTYNTADQATTTGNSHDADGNATASPALSALAATVTTRPLLSPKPPKPR